MFTFFPVCAQTTQSGLLNRTQNICYLLYVPLQASNKHIANNQCQHCDIITQFLVGYEQAPVSNPIL